jgi:phosphatidylglycerophosphate synthase
MEPLEPTSGRAVRLALVALGLLALLAVVAFATRSGFGGSSDAAPTPGYASYAFTAFLILFVLMIPVAVWALLVQAREGEVERPSFKSRVIRNFLTMIIIGAIVFGVVYLKHHHGHFRLNAQALKNLRTTKRAGHGVKAAEFEPTFEWPVLAVALVVVSVGGGLAYLSYRNRKLRTPVRLEPTVAEDFADAIGDAIGDLEAEPDPRRAVIAAYARMEGVLARHGLHRKPSETPFEYLGRILGGLTSRFDAVARLTSLFEEAKFSRHEINGAMKSEAIDALRTIRDGLPEASA